MTAFAIEPKRSCKTMEEKQKSFNVLLESWKQQFENPPTAPFSFAINHLNQLTLGGITICDINRVQADATSFDLECLYLNVRNSNHFYRIRIRWCFDETIRVEEVSLVLYQRNEEEKI